MPPTPATLTVAVQPWGDVTLDGRPLPTRRATVAPGPHTLVASQRGGRSVTRHVTLAPGEDERVVMVIPR